MPSEMLTFHHVGCVVKDLAEAIETYRPLARGIGSIVHVASQNVRICFIEVSPHSFIELIEPAGPDSAVSQLLQKRTTFYHVGFLANDFDAALGQLVAQGYMHLGSFCSEAFGMRRCAFLASPIAHLIEVIERG